MLPLQCIALIALALARGGQSSFLAKRKPAATWENWRYGIHSNQQERDAFLQDGPPERTFGLTFLKLSLDRLRSCSKEALRPPSSDQIAQKYTKDHGPKAVKLVNEAAHIYILCVECDRVSIPSAWEGKVTLANGHHSDHCLGLSGRHHYVKATLAHKLILADAKANNYSDVFVLEEDWLGREDVKINHDEVGRFYSQGTWQVFRPSFHPNFLAKTLGGCDSECQCQMQQDSNDLCALPAHCTGMASSVAYAVKQRSIDSLIETDGNIDQAVLNSLPAMLVLPAIFYQRIWEDYAIRAQGNYESRCIRPPFLENDTAADQDISPFLEDDDFSE